VALSRIPESAWLAARLETARWTTESFETSSDLLVLRVKR
jgi:hypothetical protein